MNKVLMLVGPTAVGKTKFAIELAKNLNGEIVSCDSMQLYKFMDIGSAKPTAEEQSQAKHYLIDSVDPRTPFSVAEYQKMAKEAIGAIMGYGKLPVIAGGTGLYANSLLYDMDFSVSRKDCEYRDKLTKIAEKKGACALHNMLRDLDEDAANRIHENNVKKVIRALEIIRGGGKIKKFEASFKKTKDYHVDIIGITRDREELYDRINRRVDILMENGLLDEVRHLVDIGIMESDIAMKAIGYKELLPYLNGKESLEFCACLIKKNTRHYAKRQLTWFRRYDDIKWFNLSEYANENEALEEMLKWYQNQNK